MAYSEGDRGDESILLAPEHGKELSYRTRQGAFRSERIHEIDLTFIASVYIHISNQQNAEAGHAHL